MRDTPTLPTLVFVYGTLRSGQGNNHFLCDAEFVGMDYTTPDHVMRCSGIPFVRKYTDADDPNIVGKVEGEVYRVFDEDTMAGLDRLEGHPNAYCRRLTETEAGRLVWLYYYDHTHPVHFDTNWYVFPDNRGVISYVN